MKLYVGNLSYDSNEESLKNAFEEHGQVENISIIKDKYSGRSKGFGFVEMPTDDEAKAAMDALNGTELDGREIKVNEAKPPREKRSYDNKDRY